MLPPPDNVWLRKDYDDDAFKGHIACIYRHTVQQWVLGDSQKNSQLFVVLILEIVYIHIYMSTHELVYSGASQEETCPFL